MKRFFMGLMLMVAAVAAHADAPRLRFVGAAAYGWGGDQLVYGTYVGGPDYELLAGTGWTWSVGADLRVFDRFNIQTTIGQQRNRITGSNGDYDFQRRPIEVMGFFSATEQFRIGLGVRQTFNAKVTGTGVVAGTAGTGTYDGSVGSVLEFQYLFWPASKSERAAVWGMNFRLIQESFTLREADGGTGEKKSGNQTAIGLIFYY